jgi:hypothetical protein
VKNVLEQVITKKNRSSIAALEHSLAQQGRVKHSNVKICAVPKHEFAMLIMKYKFEQRQCINAQT